MAEETLPLIPFNSVTSDPVSYVINFSGRQQQAAGIKYRLGQNPFSGPVAYKIAVDGNGAATRLRRELDVARFLGAQGGELLSKCLGYNFDGASPSTVVTFRGQPLAELVRDETNWPLDHAHRMKIVTDLLQGVELLRISSIVHGAISLNTLHWDGSTLQIVDFGQAALCGTYPDGRPAHHGDDILAVGRVMYHVHTGQPPPADPAALRRQIEQVQDVELRNLLLRRDLVTSTDLDYAFARERDGRPTARALLDRLDRRPHGVQWQHLVAREQASRAEFRHLRQQQAYFRYHYAQKSPPAPPRSVRQAAAPRTSLVTGGRSRFAPALLLLGVAAAVTIMLALFLAPR